jgi:hypothetical protein
MPVGAQAASALTALRVIATNLPLDDSLTPTALKHARATNRVPLDVMVIASNILQADQARFGDFDANEARAAVEYEQAMLPVAREARALADSIDRSVMKRRSAAATQSLALYATLKGVARIPANEKTRSHVKEMRALLTTNKKKRATSVTQAETKGLAKVARSAKVAALKSAAAKVAVEDATIAAAEAATAAAAHGSALPSAPSSVATKAPAPTPATATTPATPVETAPAVTATH